MLTLAKYSIGVGDRFARQAEAQLRACMLAAESGVEVVPVWNKSCREHAIIGSRPADARAAAEAAVRKLGWRGPYHVDADHINLKNVDGFLDACDFFTLDVADWIGRPEGIREAVREAGRIYRRILAGREGRPFITEISMDETARPQTPQDLLAILAAIAVEGIPVQTIAPKFTGRFNKGVDYVGDTARFAEEFAASIETIAEAVRMYNLPPNLKLSVHSGSDKFSLYGPMRRALGRFDAGIHLKTAGTTWLEELIGLAEAGGDGL
ncbi:MAG TPA: tagaturonate epimerase family protein, partial [Bryobacteraceae bacterium]|nr:tagaturonate epimerase family protein [Bryobacteraceae bacterium]